MIYNIDVCLTPTYHSYRCAGNHQLDIDYHGKLRFQPHEWWTISIFLWNCTPKSLEKWKADLDGRLPDSVKNEEDRCKWMCIYIYKW